MFAPVIGSKSIGKFSKKLRKVWTYALDFAIDVKEYSVKEMHFIELF